MDVQPFVIQQLLSNHLKSAGDLLLECKLALPINHLLYNEWPNLELQRATYQGAVCGAFEDSQVFCFVAVREASDEKEQDPGAVGYLAYTRKQPPGLQATNQNERTSSIVPIAPPGYNEVVFKEVVVADQRFKSQVSHLDHIEIIYLAVHPRFRRHGIASRLLAIVQNDARLHDIPIIMAVEPEAVPFFGSNGFEETGRAVDWDLAKWSTPNAGFGSFRLAQFIWRPRLLELTDGTANADPA